MAVSLTDLPSFITTTGTRGIFIISNRIVSLRKVAVPEPISNLLFKRAYHIFYSFKADKRAETKILTRKFFHTLLPRSGLIFTHGKDRTLTWFLFASTLSVAFCFQ
ncbi:MAG: hypothetical protein ABIK28_19875 [Planctomycetota bacterium]